MYVLLADLSAKKYGDDAFHVKEVWMRPNSYNDVLQRVYLLSSFQV